jgi:ABC-type uncharacterized transport system ATPase subunit
MQGTIAPEHAAVRHVLAAPRLASRTAPYVGPDDFDFAGLEREVETMSGGESLLVRVARDLWTAERTVGIAELVRSLDAANFARVLEALKIARGSYTCDLVETVVSERPEEDLAA